jgi:hypothetical protein
MQTQGVREWWAGSLVGEKRAGSVDCGFNGTEWCPGRHGEPRWGGSPRPRACCSHRAGREGAAPPLGAPYQPSSCPRTQGGDVWPYIWCADAGEARDEGCRRRAAAATGSSPPAAIPKGWDSGGGTPFDCAPHAPSGGPHFSEPLQPPNGQRGPATGCGLAIQWQAGWRRGSPVVTLQASFSIAGMQAAGLQVGDGARTALWGLPGGRGLQGRVVAAAARARGCRCRLMRAAGGRPRPPEKMVRPQKAAHSWRATRVRRLRFGASGPCARHHFGVAAGPRLVCCCAGACALARLKEH